MLQLFPDNPTWSAGTAIALATVPAGGATIGEVVFAAERLAAGPSGPEAWEQVWSDLANDLDERRALARDRGDPIGESAAALRACTYWHMADRLVQPLPVRDNSHYRRAVDCFEAARPGLPGSVERVEVAFEETHLPGYLVLPVGSRPGPLPAVAIFDGLDLTKEIWYLLAGRRLADYGIASLVIDGPGNGESIRFRGLTLRADPETAVTAAFEYLASRPDIDEARIGLIGPSAGGYLAARGAARESRLAAAVAWGAVWDYGATWSDRVAASPDPQRQFAHLLWVLGVDSIELALDRLRSFRLDGIVSEATVPFLILHGAADPQIPVDDAHRLLGAIGSEDKTLTVIDDDNLGAQHVQIDCIERGQEVIGDWLCSRLGLRRETLDPG